MHKSDSDGSGLVRGLGPWGAASLVVGTIIGTGVFLKTAVMAQIGGSGAWVLAAWGAAGLLSLVGALTYAELGAMFPAAGGEYVYLREGYGRFFAFLYGWTRFWIGTPGSIAAYAVGSAAFLGSAIGATANVETAIAVSVIAVFTAVNCLNVRTGGGLQTVLTALKVALIAALAIGALAFAKHGSWARVTSSAGFPGWAAFGTMVLAALWAYDGWNNLPMAAGEVRDPSRNLPRALVGGSLTVLAIYAVVNIGYFHALPFDDVVSSRSDAFPSGAPVAAKVASEFLGDTTQMLVAIAMAIAAISAMNGAMLTGARVPFAVARDGMAPKRLAALSEGARVPAISVVVQGVWATVLALSGKFDDLTNAVIFASWLFYALNAGSVLLLRMRQPDRPRPFRVPGFPIVPMVFVVLATLLLVNTLVETPTTSLFGVAMMALGAIVYVTVIRRLRTEPAK
jgi:APA family basic amino acid/polyamine antiporter